jgi:nitrite reductase/ring-hydroxylating ferredoxin subunit
MHALVSLTPEGINRTRVYVTIALSPDTFPSLVEKTVKAVSGKQACDILAGIMANYIQNEFDVDAMIWKHRKWLKEPNLIASEKHLANVIKWGETFYPDDYEFPVEIIKSDAEKQWHNIASLSDISDSKVSTFNIADTEIIAYKTSTGDVKVYDAYCPHQGAHLGYGGRIEDDCIRCPFHGFYFGDEGKCSGQKN